MNTVTTLFRSALLATALIAAPAVADGPIADRGEAVERAHFERDRETILSMAGNYKVRFDMQESTPWMEGYEPLDRKISGGHESVRVIEDTGTRIVLQHLLVVGEEGGHRGVQAGEGGLGPRDGVGWQVVALPDHLYGAAGEKARILDREAAGLLQHVDQPNGPAQEVAGVHGEELRAVHRIVDGYHLVAECLAEQGGVLDGGLGSRFGGLPSVSAIRRRRPCSVGMEAR